MENEKLIIESKTFMDLNKKEIGESIRKGKKLVFLDFNKIDMNSQILKEALIKNPYKTIEIIKQGFPTENLILVGIRNYNLEELKFLSEKKIKQININSIEEDIDNIADTLMEFCNGKETYLSLDLSVADEVFAPASTFSDSGGMTSRQLIYIFQRLSKIKTLRAMDLVEINSEKDKRFNDITLKLGAKILSEVL